MKNLVNTPKHRDLIYDIGMHKGEDSEFYLRKGFRVIGVEADPDLVSFCRNRLKPFLDRGQLIIIAGAILDPAALKEGQKKVRFYKNIDVSVWGTVCVNWAERNARLGASSSMVEVDVIDFADVIQEHGVPHYMKIDIEGCDMVCVDVLANFQQRPDYVSFESDKVSFANIEHEIDTLSSLGYDSFQAIEQSEIHLSQSPPYPPREGDYIAQSLEAGSSGLFGKELGDKWKSRDEILRLYRIIRLGYYLLGDDGIMAKGRFRKAHRLRSRTGRFLRFFTHAVVPGWYDTHARHSSVDVWDS